MQHYVSAATLVLLTFPAFGQSLWHGTLYGDTVEQVRAKVQGLSAPQSSDELRRNGIETMMVGTSIIAERVFEANFQFNTAGLETVILIAKLLNRTEADATYAVLVRALREKYGRAASRADARQIVETGVMWITWRAANTIILLAPQHQGKPLMVSYSLDQDKEQAIDRSASEKYIRRLSPKAEASKL